MAGYSGTPLLKKLGIKEGFDVAFVNAPKTFWKQLGPLPERVRIVTRLAQPVNFILVFSDRENTLRRLFPKLPGKLVTSGMVWIAWPKKSSGVITDLSFEAVQRVGLKHGLVDVKICAIDDVWSGLKFVYRLSDREPL